MARVAIITGATGGLGMEFIRVIDNWDDIDEIWAVGRNEDKLSNLSYSYKKVIAISVDLLKNGMEILSEKVMLEKPEIRLLINNAGVLLTDSIESIKLDDWNTTFATNTTSTMLMTKHFIDILLETKGCILNNASIDGLQSCNRGRASYAYASSKAAVIHFTQLCALNYANKGVRINCICPGVTETPFFTNIYKN